MSAHDIRADFRYHTLRSTTYPDAYWQWLKSSHHLLESALDGDQQLLTLFHVIYTSGWQYDMDIIDFPQFRDALHSAAVQLGAR